MRAVPEEFVHRAAQLSADVARRYPGSHKVSVPEQGSDIRVGMRELHESDTVGLRAAEVNRPIPVYHTSGPYADPAAHVDLFAGVPSVIPAD